jgi:hypothetical protein
MLRYRSEGSAPSWKICRLSWSSKMTLSFKASLQKPWPQGVRNRHRIVGGTGGRVPLLFRGKIPGARHRHQFRSQQVQRMGGRAPCERDQSRLSRRLHERRQRRRLEFQGRSAQHYVGEAVRAGATRHRCFPASQRRNAGELGGHRPRRGVPVLRAHDGCGPCGAERPSFDLSQIKRGITAYVIWADKIGHP